ncbi:hypothetical protein B0H11DRAFT_2230802 [Mycena galericulata]|nr:hypothetical protein B0H11DRAFT_2230802 [Mycena galericulata]
MSRVKATPAEPSRILKTAQRRCAVPEAPWGRSKMSWLASLTHIALAGWGVVAEDFAHASCVVPSYKAAASPFFTLDPHHRLKQPPKHSRKMKKSTFDADSRAKTPEASAAIRARRWLSDLFARIQGAFHTIAQSNQNAQSREEIPLINLGPGADSNEKEEPVDEKGDYNEIRYDCKKTTSAISDAAETTERKRLRGRFRPHTPLDVAALSVALEDIDDQGFRQARTRAYLRSTAAV